MPFTDVLTLLAPGAPVALGDLSGCAALGAVFAAFGLECAAAARRQAFLDKLAQQMANLALVALLFAVAAGGAAGALLAPKVPGAAAWALAPASPAVAFGASLGFTLFCLAVYRSTWKNLRQRKAPHLYLGGMAALGALASVYTAAVAAKDFAARFLLEPSVAVAPARLWAPGTDGLLWPGVLGSLGLCLCYAGLLAPAWLVLRRNRDDFGRDYYNFALPRAARLALWALLPALAGLGWGAALLPGEVAEALKTMPLAGLAGGGAGLLVLALGCALALSASRLPLRLKGLALLAPVLAWGAHTALAVLLLLLAPQL